MCSTRKLLSGFVESISDSVICWVDLGEYWVKTELDKNLFKGSLYEGMDFLWGVDDDEILDLEVNNKEAVEELVALIKELYDGN